MIVHIARPYASALYDLAQSENSLEAAESGLVSIQNLIAESPDFSRFLRSPVIGTEEKTKVVEAILRKAHTNGLIANFMRLVARNGRLFALPVMIAAFRELAARSRGEVSAEVTSAAPLNQTQRDSLAATLKQKIGKTVTLQEHVDPSLIGGLVVKVGSQMIDSSLKTKLTAMKIAMKEVG